VPHAKSVPFDHPQLRKGSFFPLILEPRRLDLTLRSEPAGNGPGPSRSSILTGTRCWSTSSS